MLESLSGYEGRDVKSLAPDDPHYGWRMEELLYCAKHLSSLTHPGHLVANAEGG